MDRCATFVIAALVGFLGITLQGCSNPVEGACNAGPVGSCGYVGCYPTRGPTQCIGNSCMCHEGYCKYGDGSTARCRAEVKGATCSMSKVCWSGGLVSSTCVDGRCLCRSNMHLGPDNQCHMGWDPVVLLAANTTDLTSMMGEADMEETLAVMLNVALGSAYIMMPLALFAGAIVRFRRSRDLVSIDSSEEAESPALYTKLAADTTCA
eukprot:TRINITY_DN32044_c0_g1_i1.p1 TRINITY_DN32044_c0_g1~~TRINITY_DN32044_c0_g1_i1.p1  ORF type:complete len:208 (-),score=42.90 TRINITY_DN32044_c0_g1_i1:146-769(-)